MSSGRNSQVNRQRWERLARYGVTGTLTLFVYLIAGFLLDNIGVEINILGPLAFSSAVIFSYFLQKFWVFSDTRPVAQTLPRFFVMISVGCIINGLSLSFFREHSPLFVAQLIAAILVIISNAVFSFVWVFSRAYGR